MRTLGWRLRGAVEGEGAVDTYTWVMPHACWAVGVVCVEKVGAEAVAGNVDVFEHCKRGEEWQQSVERGGRDGDGPDEPEW